MGEVVCFFRKSGFRTLFVFNKINCNWLVFMALFVGDMV